MSTTRDDLEENNIQLSIVNDGYGLGSGYQRTHVIGGSNITSEKSGQLGVSETEDSKKKPQYFQERFPAWWNWNMVFVISCVLAVSLDPLFFYIPIIDREKKCLKMHTTLRNIALPLRALTDVTLIIHIIYQIREAYQKFKDLPKEIQAQTGGGGPIRKPGWAAQYLQVQTQGPKLVWDIILSKIYDVFEYVDGVVEQLSWRSFVTDILAVLPIPQVLLVVVLFKMKGSNYLEYRKLLNFFLLAQYVARVFRIYLSSRKLTKTNGIWLKGLFNFFLYILASHVLGAFWYFFSIQRETNCWNQNSKPYYDVYMKNFFCNNDTANGEEMKNLSSILDKNCSVNYFPNNEEPVFDFGIFLDSLKSGNTKSTNFPEKFTYCFWWGLRNLSNFGTNLATSDYVWENFFAILISIIGLLLFLYLIGNVQTFMSMRAEKSEEIRQKMQKKAKDITTWMSTNRVPLTLRKKIREDIEQKLEEDKDADIENLFNILPFDTKKKLKRVLCMDALSKVPRLQGMDVKVLKMVCDHLRPVKYPEHSFVVKIDDPVDRMIFITKGTMWIYSSATGTDASQQLQTAAAANTSPSPSSSIIQKAVEEGQFYGDDELLGWVSHNITTFQTLPTSKQNVKCHSDVEGFALTAKDLQTVVSKCKFLWKYPNAEDVTEVASGVIGRATRRRHRGTAT